MHNNILQRIETHMYEQVFSSDKENDERSFDEICDEALKLFKSQCDNIHFKAIDDRDVELLSDDKGLVIWVGIPTIYSFIKQKKTN